VSWPKTPINFAFNEGHTSKTSSGSNGVLLGRPTNGWQEQKTEFGGTLGELK